MANEDELLLSTYRNRLEKMRESEEFQLVTYRKKRKSHARNTRVEIFPAQDNRDSENDRDFNSDTLFGKLHEAEIELKNSPFADQMFYYLKESVSALRADGISEIVCYGLGRFSSRRSSKYQLALLICLKKQYNSQIYVYDPMFSSDEVKFLKKLGFNVINRNEEGKRILKDCATLVYMPHCSTRLTNNFLYANWSEKLSKCVLLTNSFSVVANDMKISFSTDYVSRIGPYVTEVALKNSFAYREVFNDLNIHVFRQQDLCKVPQSFWEEREEPCYRDAAADYITSEQTDARNSNNIFHSTDP